LTTRAKRPEAFGLERGDRRKNKNNVSFVVDNSGPRRCASRRLIA
jgi:hypothetical protein